MLALSFLLVAVFLLLKWFYSPSKISRPGRMPEHKCEGFLASCDKQRSYVVNIASRINDAREKSSNLFLRGASAVQRYLLVQSGLNNMSLDMPESVLYFGQGAGGFINEILGAEYRDNTQLLVDTLGRYISRPEAQDYTTKCATEETHQCALPWTAKQDVELFEGVAEIVHKAVTRTILGDDFQGSSDELHQLTNVMSSEVRNPWAWLLPSRMQHPAIMGALRARDGVREIFAEKLGRRDAAAVAGGPLEVDLPDYTTYMLNEGFTASRMHLVSSIYMALMLTTHGSAVASISWVIVCLLRHPDVMNAVRSNARSRSGNPVLLQACIRETMRYYANKKYLHLAMKRDRASGTDVAVQISLHFRQHAISSSQDADSWMPGRWINAENKLVDLNDERREGSECPSESIRMIVITQVLKTLLRSYDISWASPSQSQTVDFKALDFDKIGLPWLKGGLRVKTSRRIWPEMVGGC
ncbi:hypothetical protein CSOJ01_01882 [Colletotrichum sojae]|uniref:Cytochrome P450 n=1 Tax=Colletotrichum sojae TaxID=2175907 RepID=A0A8H6JSC9_9PEZI|nr:hypothetical protein CSOJ01_01882 [Colletotrichum sojae]